MKITFDSKREIKRIAKILSTSVYPNALELSVHDLEEATRGPDRELPWDEKGDLHWPMMPVEVRADELLSSGVWEEVEKDGRKYLRQIKGADIPLNSEEEAIYAAGQFDAYMRFLTSGRCTMEQLCHLTGCTEPHLADMSRIWARRQAGR